MEKPTKSDAELLLQIIAMMQSNSEYRKAARWFSEELGNLSYDEFKSKYPKGSDGYRNFTLFTGFYELVSTLVNNDLLNAGLIFDIWGNLAWKKADAIVQGIRKDLEWSRLYENYEFLAKKYPEWNEMQAPKV